MALPDCCDDIVGGEVYITAKFQAGHGSGGGGGPGGQGGGDENAPVQFEGMGEVRIQPSRVTRASGASSGGAVWITETARPVKVLMSYINRCSHDPMQLFMQRCLVDISVIEKSRGFTHIFNSAHVTGDPEKNLTTGEITGIELVGGSYTVITAEPEDTIGNLLPTQV
jgi:hypothetical protein